MDIPQLYSIRSIKFDFFPSGHKDIKRDMGGERGGGIVGDRDGNIEGGREEDGQDGVLSDTAVPVEILKSYIRQHATDSHLKDEFSVGS